MGGGYSVSYSQQLVCPSDCDQQVFQQILSLYDRLDANGDHAVENKELQSIARLHIDNEILRIKRKIEEAKQGHKRQLTYIRASNAQEMARLREKLATKQNQLAEDFKLREEKLNEHIDCLEKMEEGLLPQKWMGKKIAPIKSWGGCDVDYEWQIPAVEYWLKKSNFKNKK